MSVLSHDAAIIARALGGRRVGLGWIMCCPAHDDCHPSLSIRCCDGKVLVRCHAGCSQAQVIAALRARGLWAGRYGTRSWPMRPAPRSTATEDSDCDNSRTEAALRLWHSARLGSGTLVEAYLRSRSIRLLPPAMLRFHAGLKHCTGGIWPA